MHVVFGANGRAGGETARALMADGEPVRVVVRRPEQGKAWAALGAEVAVASLDN
ncbi:MAG: NmrA family protein, partial [Mesorhizobium sp.]